VNTETKPGLVLPVDTIRDRLNRDPEFLLTARFWYCDIRFFIDHDLYFMRIENGTVDHFQHGSQGFDPYTINIGGLHHVTDSRPNSKVLFQKGSDRSFYETQIRKEIAVQKWDATMDLIAAARKKIFGAATSLENPSP